MRKLFFAWFGIFGAIFFLASCERSSEQISDESVCARIYVVGLRPNTNERARRVIRGIAPKSTPKRIVVCSGVDPFIASAQTLETATRGRDKGWLITVDDAFLLEAPDDILRAVMAHEVGHLVLNEFCNSSDGLKVECEHDIDLFASTVVGKCSITRSLEWILGFNERHGRTAWSSFLPHLIEKLDPQKECDQGAIL